MKRQMNKIGLIIRREYFSRVRKKTFIILTLLGPLLIAGGISLVIWLGIEESEQQKVLVVDQLNPVFSSLESDERVLFDYSELTLEEAKLSFHETDYTSILFIPENIVSGSHIAQLYFKKQPSMVVVRNIETKVEGIIEELKLKQYNISREAFYDVKTNYSLQTIKYTEVGKEEAVSQDAAYIGFFFGLLIYLFIFLYGVQVMRGVMEEKTNRIVEVIISSVKPFQLMMGKIVGVALVGLTQIALWIVLTVSIVFVVQNFIIPEAMGVDVQEIMATEDVLKQMNNQNGLQPEFNLNDPNSIIQRTPWALLIGLFLFYFLGGYLLYSALFAAVGAAVDNETDSQQFMLPITLPLILAYVMSTIIVQNPEGPAAFWFSIIPFTSPVVMLVRVAIGVGDGGTPIWEVGLSMGLLVLTFIAVVWLAGRIYRTGILMYGKKVSYKELWKWLRY